jgi:transposase
MNITKEQYERIAPYFPRQRGNVKIDNFTFISAILYMTENGCKWRALPDKFGNWNSIYRRFERWAENGVMQRIFAALQAEQIISISVEILALDSTSCKVHPDAHGALKKEESSQSANQKAVGTPSFMWYPQMIRSSLRCTSPAASVTTVPKGESQ